jgi:hypothetical protein
VEVISYTAPDGLVTPLEIIWDDGRRFKVDHVIDRRHARSLKTGGTGMRYQIAVGRTETYLYFEAKEGDLGRKALGIDASRRAVGIVESSFFSEADWIQLTQTVGEDLEGKLAHYEKEKGFTSLTDYSEADEAFQEFIA